MMFEEDLSREVAKWAAKETASRRFGRPLTREEQSFYESKVNEFYDLLDRPKN